MKTAVLGAGLIGTAIAIDLSKDTRFEVLSVDNNQENLAKLESFTGIEKVISDISLSDNLVKVIMDCDLVINALPSSMGYSILKELILAEKNVVDITFFEEDPFTLSDLAVKNGVTALVDCGIAPGMSNLLAGHIVSELDETHSLSIYVGGVPSVKCPPWHYKAVFAPRDVINEYTRPARLVVDGSEVILEALTDPEEIVFEGHGTFEAFNTDGLRTLVKTLPVKNMREKTIRYPGHLDKIKVLKESGFFSEEKIAIKEYELSPLEMTSSILFPQWKMKKDDRDKTLFKIVAEGIKESKSVTFLCEMVDEYDEENGVHSMARTTGYTATSMAALFAENIIDRKGIIAPEFLGKEQKYVDFVLNRMKDHGINFNLKLNEAG